MSNAVQYLIVLLAGVTLTLAYAPFSLWIIPFLALPVTFFVFLKYPKLSGFKAGFAFGVGWFGAGISWVHVSIANFGGLPLIGSLALMAMLVSYLALFPATAFWLYRKFIGKEVVGLYLKALSFSIIWFLMEWIRSWFLTGFPWLSLGYTQINGPLASLYPVVGETGVTFVLVFFCFYIGYLLSNILSDAKSDKRPNIIKFTVAALLISIVSLVPRQLQFTEITPQKVKVAMVQGNIKQELRWVPEQDIPTMEKYLELSKGLWDNDIMLWPEAAVPKLEPLAQEYLNLVDALAFESNTGLITGIVNYNFETNEAYNNLIVLGKASREQQASEYQYFHANRYSKHHLLPIGEFIPMESWLRGLAPIFDLPMSSFTRGDYEQHNLQVNGYQMLPAICFEIAFPGQIAANLREHTDFLLTVSNDAWFGESHGPAQHLEIAQVRAAEFGLPLLRATNNGITAFINHKGELISSAPQFQEAYISAELNLTSGVTPYRYWGNFPLWLMCMLASIWLLRHKTRRQVAIGTANP